MPDAPLILTLALDAAAQERLDALRRQHFPPERNVLAAHVTAFHALPADRADQVLADLVSSAPGQPVPVAVDGVRFLGRGVAIDVRAPVAERVRADLAGRWQPWLTAQDCQRWRPHVTVQNKVDPDVARVLHAQLTAGFSPWDTVAVGWRLYRYLGGPWEYLRSVPFER
ncbi:2'-5' RNA ligase family protein [Cellulomonas sp. ATA003]|uniref:2'-5' RNA ligase family protein n=1 Tax=Cellulomonas sp. ATA003 TaxID=3073064 RepID=UPI0028733C4E|nr:2'-5' RNA ligase family protein [Cellulomonas sp. ATA003]WNB85650.1 2'-5' RNA ligase family protein [Cellulomonas sp. ATA003]